MDKELDKIKQFISELDLCGNDMDVDMHDIEFGGLENRGAAPYLLIHPQEFNAP